MSSKSNDDNRSNQLNPNNETYYSSRGISGYDDDEYEHYDSRDVVDRLRDDMNDLIRRERHIKEWQTLVCEEFTFDFMSMNGSKVHLKATAQLPHKNYSNTLISDCIDLIEKGLYPFMRRAFEKEVDSPIVFSRVRDGEGNELFWIQEEYMPRQNHFNYSPEEQQKITQQNETWVQATKFMVDDFREKLQNYKALPREDIGFIITPENFRKIRNL